MLKSAVNVLFASQDESELCKNLRFVNILLNAHELAAIILVIRRKHLGDFIKIKELDPYVLIAQNGIERDHVIMKRYLDLTDHFSWISPPNPKLDWAKELYIHCLESTRRLFDSQNIPMTFEMQRLCALGFEVP